MNFQTISRSRTSVAVAALAMLACSAGDTDTAFAKSVPTRNIDAVPASAAPAPGVMLRFVLAPTKQAAALPLPASGSRAIEMTGDLTVRGVTRPTTWKGTVNFRDGRVLGSAATEFTFNDFQIEQPRVPVLLSVADTIRLEIDFNLIPQR